MSVVTQKLLQDPIASVFHTQRPGDPCLYCGNALPEPPYVIWQGAEGTQIGLHARCASKLAACLILDANLAESLPLPTARPHQMG